MDEDGFFILNRGSLEFRLDPVFYKPSIIAFVDAIKKLGAKPVHAISTKVVDGPFGTQLKVDEYQNEGVPVIRVSNVRTGEISEDNLIYITPEKQFQLRRSKVLPNDVVLTKAGAILGYAAVFPEHLKEGNITSHSAAITCGTEVLPHYLKLIFHSSIGQKQIYRWGNKSTRPELNTQEVKRILVPVLPINKQEELIAKYHQIISDRKSKEAQAAKLLAGIDDYLLNELGISLPSVPANTIENRTFKTSFTKLSGNRFDPFFNKTYFYGVKESISKGKYGAVFLKQTITGLLVKGYLPKQEEKEGDNKVVQINSINMDGTIDLDNLLTAKDVFNAYQELKQDDILVVITGATIGKVGYWSYPGKYYLGGDIVKFQTDKSKFDPYFVYAFLRCKPSQIEIKRNVTGATNGHLSPDDVKHLLIPAPPLSVQQMIAKEVRVRTEEAHQLLVQAKMDFEAAKKEIEKLILNTAS